MKKRVIDLITMPVIVGAAGVVGKTEGEGPLSQHFDYIFTNDGMGESTWESAEKALCKKAMDIAIVKSGLTPSDIEIAFGGDLVNQCTPSAFGMKEFNIPFAGLFGACSTFALGLALAALTVDRNIYDYAAAEASSHFCSAEKQFRMPLEYGSQRPPTAQRTVSGAGACILGNAFEGVCVKKVMIGKICDRGVTDATNFGAVMAPAAVDTAAAFLQETNTSPSDYGMILTGDLGKVGSELMTQLLKEEHSIDISGVQADCGNLIFDAAAQDVHCGGSGCGCSASVVASYIRKRILNGETDNVLFIGTGALMSPLSALQGDTVPGIAHAVLLSKKG